MAEERIALQRQAGSLSENGALQAIGESRKKLANQLREQIVVQERVSATQPENQELILNIERARLELEKLDAVADPLADKFRELFTSAGANSINDFITGAKSAKDALRSFGNEIFSDLTSNAARRLSEQIFSKDGILGEAGGIFAELFGDKKKDAISIQTAGIESSLSALQATGINPTTSALTRLQQMADNASNALQKLALVQERPVLILAVLNCQQEKSYYRHV